MTKLICPECQRENEGERIYCHSCGARLDRAGLASGKDAPEATEQTHQRLQRLFDPHRGRLRRMFFAICKLILSACLAAVILQMVLPLDLAPPPKVLGVAPQINFDLEKAALYHHPAQFQYTQDEVNAYLAYTLKSKKTSLDKPELSFKRAVVGLGEGTCTVTVERVLFGYSLYQRASYQVSVAGGKTRASNKGGWIGRLPIHPAIMRYGDILFADVWSALNRERKLVAQMGGIELHDGSVILTAPPQ
jgi:hypothetical protein